MNHLPELPAGPLLFVALAIVVVASSLPISALVIAAEPVLMAVLLTTNHNMSIVPLLTVTIVAAVIGDMVSYWLGRVFGPKLTTKTKRRSRKQIYRTHRNIQRRGALGALVIQRWLPPARGFVPAFLGAAGQPFGRFVGYSVVASAAWALVFILGIHFGGPTLILAIPAVMTVLIVIRATRRLGRRLRHRRGRESLLLDKNGVT